MKTTPAANLSRPALHARAIIGYHSAQTDDCVEHYMTERGFSTDETTAALLELNAAGLIRVTDVGSHLAYAAA